MKRQDYYPSLLPEQVLWLQGFANRLPNHAPALHQKPEEIAGAVADARWLAYVLGPWRASIRTTAKASTSALELTQTGAGSSPFALPVFNIPPLPEGVVPVPAGALKRIFRMVRLIKYDNGYTKAMGIDLGFNARPDGRVHLAPTFKLSTKRGNGQEVVVIKLRKWGNPAIAIESRRNGEDWQPIGVTTETVFNDVRPLLVPTQPELRDYRLRFYRDDKPTGDWSSVATITVSL